MNSILIFFFILTSLSDLFSTLYSIRSVYGIKESFIWMRKAIEMGENYALLLQVCKTFLFIILFFTDLLPVPIWFKVLLISQQIYATVHNVLLYRRKKCYIN